MFSPAANSISWHFPRPQTHAARGEQATLRFREIFLEQAANFRELRMHGWLATHTPDPAAPTLQ